jgi:hypothetical protein
MRKSRREVARPQNEIRIKSLTKSLFSDSVREYVESLFSFGFFLFLLSSTLLSLTLGKLNEWRNSIVSSKANSQSYPRNFLYFSVTLLCTFNVSRTLMYIAPDFFPPANKRINLVIREHPIYSTSFCLA